MSTTEHSVNTSSATGGLPGVLAGLAAGRGSGARAAVRRAGTGRRRAWRSVAVGCVLVVIGLLAAGPAFAAEPPEMQANIVGIHPTHAQLDLYLVTPPSGEETYLAEVRSEYAESESGPYTVVARSVGTKQNPANDLSGASTNYDEVYGLAPSHTYYVRFFAETGSGGSRTLTIKFTTPPPSAPEFEEPSSHAAVLQAEGGGLHKTDASSSFTAYFTSNDEETTYSFEYATAEAGPYKLFASGTVPATEERATKRKATLSGLAPETTYYIRVTLENAAGRTSKTITYTTLSDHLANVSVNSGGVTTTSAQLSGNFISWGFGVLWRLEYATNGSGPWSVAGEGLLSEAEMEAHGGQDSVGPVELSGLKPATTYYARLFVESEPGSAITETSFTTIGPPVVRTFVTHALENEAVRVYGWVDSGLGSGGLGYEAHQHLQYVSQRQFEAGGWAVAASTPEEAVNNETVSDRLPFTELQPGETYRYRFVASNTTAGDPVVVGSEETLTVPTPAPAEAPALCPNEAFRVGPAARLPDCRAYEQVTPTEKGGSQAAFSYVGALEFRGYAVGGDGEHVLLHDPGVKWGASPGPTQGNYVFSRTSSGWRMASAKPVGEPGPNDFSTEVANPDLTAIGFMSWWDTGLGGHSPNDEFVFGSSGGPYSTIASVPNSKAPLLVGESAMGARMCLRPKITRCWGMRRGRLRVGICMNFRGAGCGC